jgi:ubiquinone/menaquinone biosynthesis C-methylase UbiE
VCCGIGAGVQVLRSLCQGRVTGVDFSACMLAQARNAHPDATWVRADARALPVAEVFDLAVTFGALGHFLPTERPALFQGVYRALRPCGLFTIPIGAPPPRTSVSYWARSGSTWPCGSAMPRGAPGSSCTTAPARCPQSATT